MINRLIILTSVIILSGNAFAETPDSLYYQANEKYQEGKYEEAIELYQAVISAGYESSILYYNLGNACFRSNKLGISRLYYEKALKLEPYNEDAKGNLAFLENLLVDKFNDMPVFFLRKWTDSLVRLMNSDKWAMISMITFILAFCSFAIYLLLRQILIRKTGFYSGIVFLLISLLSFLFSWQQRKHEVIPESAVVIDYLVNVKSTPRETGTDLFVLHEGTKVWLEDMAADWREIRLSDGRKGWLPSSTIEAI